MGRQETDYHTDPLYLKALKLPTLHVEPRNRTVSEPISAESVALAMAKRVSYAFFGCRFGTKNFAAAQQGSHYLCHSHNIAAFFVVVQTAPMNSLLYTPVPPPSCIGHRSVSQ